MYREYTVLLPDGRQIKKLFLAGNIVRVNQEDGNRPLTFDMAINRGKDREAEFVNGIAVRRDAPYYELVKEFKKGQQIFAEVNITKKTVNGKSYKNYWLNAFAYGRSPAPKQQQ